MRRVVIPNPRNWRLSEKEKAEREETRQIIRAAMRAARKLKPKQGEKLPTIEQYALMFIEKCRTVKNPYTSILKDADAMLPYLADLDDELAIKIADATDQMTERHVKSGVPLAEAFRSKNHQRVRGLLN